MLVLIGGLVSWYLKDRTEALRTEREKFQRDRLNIYLEILEPVLGAFVYQDSTQKQSRTIAKIASDQYRKKSFELILYGSDEVVRAWGDFMQHMYRSNEAGTFDLKASLQKLGAVLLAVRKDLGNKNTDLDNLEIFKWYLKDFHTLEK